jgi:hypothetical protein
MINLAPLKWLGQRTRVRQIVIIVFIRLIKSYCMTLKLSNHLADFLIYIRHKGCKYVDHLVNLHKKDKKSVANKKIKGSIV